MKLGIGQGAEVAVGSSAIEVAAVVGVGGVDNFGLEQDCSSAKGWRRMGVVFEVVAESPPWDGSRHGAAVVVVVAAGERAQAVDIHCCRREKRDIGFVHSSGRFGEALRCSSVARSGSHRLESLDLEARWGSGSCHSGN